MKDFCFHNEQKLLKHRSPKQVFSESYLNRLCSWRKIVLRLWYYYCLWHPFSSASVFVLVSREAQTLSLWVPRSLDSEWELGAVMRCTSGNLEGRGEPETTYLHLQWGTATSHRHQHSLSVGSYILLPSHSLLVGTVAGMVVSSTVFLILGSTHLVISPYFCFLCPSNDFACTQFPALNPIPVFEKTEVISLSHNHD